MSNIFHHPKLDAFIEELLKWNRKINLIGRKTEKSVREEHIDDSFMLMPFLQDDPVETVIDIGSGGGIPAIPLSIAIPEKHFILTDVNSKKITFLNWVIAKLDLNAEAVNVQNGFRFDGESLIISRAFSDIPTIVEWKDRHAPAGCSALSDEGKDGNDPRRNLGDDIGY